MRESVPTARYSPVCNVLRQWKTSLIVTYRVYRLYDIGPMLSLQMPEEPRGMTISRAEDTTRVIGSSSSYTLACPNADTDESSGLFHHPTRSNCASSFAPCSHMYSTFAWPIQFEVDSNHLGKWIGSIRIQSGLVHCAPVWM